MVPLRYLQCESSHQTNKQKIQSQLNTNRYAHCQLVNIILTPKDTTIQSSKGCSTYISIWGGGGGGGATGGGGGKI